VTRGGPRPFVVGNWKMNLGEESARKLIHALVATLPFDRVDAAIAPAFPCLRAALDASANTPLAVGAQNVHWQDKGAFTGEVAPMMLVEMGVRFVIVGHSERRALFGETDETVSRKVGAAARHGLIPILCVGESAEQHREGRTREVVVTQVRAAVADFALGTPGELVVAYEPVWAIGTGLTPRPADVTGAHRAIRAALAERLGDHAAEVRILYGGSVIADNALSLLESAEVDGALVGGASLDPVAFGAIAAAAASC